MRFLLTFTAFLVALPLAAGPFIVPPPPLTNAAAATCPATNCFPTNNPGVTLVTGPSSASSSQTGSGATAFTMSSTALSSFGTLQAGSSLTMTSYSGSTLPHETIAEAFFRELLTVNTGAFFVPIFTITGSIVDQDGGNAGNAVPYADLIVTTRTGDSPAERVSETCVLTGANTCTFSPRPVIAGSPFVFAVALFTQARVQPNAGGVLASGTLKAEANFSNTVTLTGIQILDANGNPITTFQITSGSGQQYTAAGVVPEPAASALLGGGLLTLALAARRRRR